MLLAKTRTTVARQQCDAFAISHAGGESTALQMQGVCSYTVTAGPNKSKLFQFRDESSIIDMGNISLAKAIHPKFVASCKYLGTMPDSPCSPARLPGPHLATQVSGLTKSPVDRHRAQMAHETRSIG